jgi:hypothetical protein
MIYSSTASGGTTLLQFIEKNKVELHWVPVTDKSEPTANAERYVVYPRIDDGGFNNGVLVETNRLTLNVQPGKIYSFKVAAINKGGESFPSEILSVYRALHEKGEVLIVNGFDRVSAPTGFVLDTTYAGFVNDDDAGVPYLHDISFIGKQYEFRRNKPLVGDDARDLVPFMPITKQKYCRKQFRLSYLNGKE